MATPQEALQNRADLLRSKLTSSPTAYAPNTLPSRSDVSTDTQLSSVNKQIEDLRSKNLRTTWYGPDSDTPTEDTGGNDGILMSGFKALQRPLNAIVGTEQYLLGKGAKSTLSENINNAMSTGLVHGDLLKQFGVPRWVQVPLGFMMDVAGDPVNWGTMGTSALVPRVAAPLTKYGLKSVGLLAKGTEKEGLMNALKATGVGLTSNLAKKAATTMDFMPFARKMSQIKPVIEETGIKTGFLTKAAQKYTNLADDLSRRAIAGAEKYDELIGSTISDRVNMTPYGFRAGLIGEKVENVIRTGKIPLKDGTDSLSIPGLGFLGKEVAPNLTRGDKIADFFKYSPHTAAEVDRYRDQAFQLARDEEHVLLVSGDKGFDFKFIADLKKPGATITVEDVVRQTRNGIFKDADGALVRADDVLTGDKGNLYRNREVGITDEAGKLLEKLPRQIIVQDNFENTKYLLGASVDDLNLRNIAKSYKIAEPGKTGFQWYDDKIEQLKGLKWGDMIPGTTKTLQDVTNEADELIKTVNAYDNKLLNLKPLEKLLTAYPAFISMFKSAKVPSNPASHVVATIGNYFMGAMMGLPVYKTEYINAVKEARTLLGGKLGIAEFNNIFGKDVGDLWDMMENNPNSFRRITGINAFEIHSKIALEGKIMGQTKEEVLKYLKGSSDDIEREVLKRAAKTKKALMPKYSTGTDTTREIAKDGSVTQGELGTAFSQEMSNETMDIIKDWSTRKVAENPNNFIVKIADTIINGMPRWYEQIDQSYKIGTTNFLIRHGLTEQELRVVTRTVPMKEGDLVLDSMKNFKYERKNGEKLYRLTPLYAAEVAMETYMNYAAMPDFVKMVRAIPFGGPFASFAYAMAIKTGKTAINNPAIFNKAGFMINEMNAGRSPQEKEAMESKYNQYLKSQTVVKMFDIYNTNVKNMIPFYQMQMLNPTERDYGNSVQGKIFGMFDKVPVFQDPVGSLIKNYWIQPWVLSGSGETPQGQFGQPLYPTFDVNGKRIQTPYGTQAFYQGKELLGSIVPGAASYLGLANLPLGLSGETINKIPLGYGFQSMANATQGRGSIGATSNENTMQRTLRTLFGKSGVPVYPLDITKTSSK